MLHLRVHARSSRLASRRSLRWLRPHLNARSAAVAGARIVVVAVVVVVVVSAIATGIVVSAIASVVVSAIGSVVVSAIAGVVVVCVVDRAHVDVVVHAVIEEVAAVPVAAFVAEADVAEAVIDAAVETDVQAPMSGIKEIAAAVEPPIARRPKRGCVGWLDPCSRHPVIAARAPGPIARSPNVAVSGRGRLIVVGKRRRRIRRLLCRHLSVARIIGRLARRRGRLVGRRSFSCVGRT